MAELFTTWFLVCYLILSVASVPVSFIVADSNKPKILSVVAFLMNPVIIYLCDIVGLLP